MKNIAAFDYMIVHKLKAYRCDPWGHEPITTHYESLEGFEGQVNYKNEIFVVTQHNGGGAGMGAYPASTDVIKIEV